MIYNSQKDKLILPEYGRIIQSMVEKAVAITDNKERQKVAENIIDLMGFINPHLRNVEDYKHKLWDHLLIMSDFKLKVESPYPIPKKEDFEHKPDPIPYPGNQQKHRHYGRNIVHLIDQIKDSEDVERKKVTSEVIANYLKIIHANWNLESVPDEFVKSELYNLSDGKLELDEESTLTKVQVRKNNQRMQRSNNGRRNGRNNQGRRKYQSKRM